MELTIKEQNQQPLMGREQVKADITYEGATPSTTEIKKKIADNLKKEENVVAIEKIETKFGKQTAKVVANVYNDEAALLATEPEHVKRKNLPKKEGEEKKEEAKSEEKPAEGKAKEESPTEENKKEESDEEPKKESGEEEQKGD